jgi:succinate-semialdehyde dehydrogenase/glutarate-semialdehyde dehydrogenase
MQAKMRNMGEACTAANRFFVHAAVAEEFTAGLTERMSSLVVGPGLEPNSQVGPLIDEPSRGKVIGLVADALDRGADLLTGGTADQRPGYFYQPTVLTNVSAGADLNSTEIFGPVAAIQTFTDDNDAVRRAGQTEWGLAAYIYTRDLDRALSVSEDLKVGMVGLNAGIVSNPATPFGGVKQSGLGREGGRVGIEEFLDTKLIMSPAASADPATPPATTDADARSPRW